ncbi:protein of unknown function [Cupriavidus taiwanensis]|uniref:Uncharacterized protein n=1 Tax=Cupriavidus taiwanensis TaxID=164546 RepID=A0A9Q7UVF1_9BURK|nr:protein of unknown function [Cupriavidus taiwanensis]
MMPDSISSTLATRSLSRMPLLLSVENTAAASVEPTMAPSSSPSRQSMPSSQAANIPTSAAVTSTPTVASDRDGLSATRKVAKRVRSPPSSRMMASARLPTRKLSQVSEKRMPPGPSTPASMPTARNTSRTGTPKRAENAPSTMPSDITTAPSRMTWSMLSKTLLVLPGDSPAEAFRTFQKLSEPFRTLPARWAAMARKTVPDDSAAARAATRQAACSLAQRHF